MTKPNNGALRISHGSHSATGPKPRNEDAFSIVTPSDASLLTKGMLFLLADGVSGSDNGQLAAQLATRNISGDYYATPDTWEIPMALDKVMSACNRWLLGQKSQDGFHSLLTTLTGVVLRGNRFCIAHVGDSRAYRLRGTHFEQLTTDHVWDKPDMRHVLKRALGLDKHLEVDFIDGALEVGDRFILLTDGVWATLSEKRIHELLYLHQDPQRAAQNLVESALTANTQDNASALVIQIDAIPAQRFNDLVAESRNLPVPEKLKAGQSIDDFIVDSVLYESRNSVLYLVKQAHSEQRFVLKTLQPIFAEDKEIHAHLLAEEWLAKRVTAHYFPQVLPRNSAQRNWLYYVMSWHSGETLAQKLSRGAFLSSADCVSYAIRLVKAVAVLHRLNILHRDIKPDNIHISEDGKLRVLDFGVAYCEGLYSAAESGSSNPGTPSYMAPELLEGEFATAQTDLYAVGVTLYQLLTNRYPYGEIEAFQRPKFGDPTPPTRYRPDIPFWLESLVLKAVSREAKLRFETAEEMLLALERGDSQPVFAARRSPLASRDPQKLWQAIALISILINLFMLYVFVVGKA